MRDNIQRTDAAVTRPATIRCVARQRRLEEMLRHHLGWLDTDGVY
jgi:hypothetical protein